jgi:hypothetical protein
MPTEAGHGEYHVYKIVPSSSDSSALTKDQNYLGIDAVSWFVNKESSFWTDRVASGTLDITLAGGLEKYQVALGTFELKDGSKTAPVFDRPVLPDRNFRGGVISVSAFLTSIKKDTSISNMLKSAASASLGVVAGMVQTASLTGPAKILGAAGEDLLGGVKKVLTDTADKKEPIFDIGGFELTVQPTELVGPNIYLLLHRGADLSQASIEVRLQGNLIAPFADGSPLQDGAWLLLRLRKTSEYAGVRDWFEALKALKNNIVTAVQDFQDGNIPKDEALKRLSASSTGNQTLFDEFARLRAIILSDGVLTTAEASTYVAQVRTSLVAARKAITDQTPQPFHTLVADFQKAALSGQLGSNPLAGIFIEGLSDSLKSRSSLASIHLDSALQNNVVDQLGTMTKAIMA